MVPLQHPPVDLHKLLGGAAPAWNSQVGEVRVDGLEYDGVGEELRYTLIWAPLVHALHRSRVFPGHPLGPHPRAQHLLAGTSGHVHVIGHIGGDVPDVVGGGAVLLVAAPSLVPCGGVRVVQLVVSLLNAVL